MIVVQASNGATFENREELEAAIAGAENNSRHWRERVEEGDKRHAAVEAIAAYDIVLSELRSLRNEFDLLDSLDNTKHITVNQQVDTVTGSLTGLQIEML